MKNVGPVDESQSPSSTAPGKQVLAANEFVEDGFTAKEPIWVLETLISSMKCPSTQSPTLSLSSMKILFALQTSGSRSFFWKKSPQNCSFDLHE